MITNNLLSFIMARNHPFALVVKFGPHSVVSHIITFVVALIYIILYRVSWTLFFNNVCWLDWT